MAEYALIKDGVVVNTIVCPEAFIDTYCDAPDTVDCDLYIEIEDAPVVQKPGPGWSYDDALEVFDAPTIEVLDEELPIVGDVLGG